MAHYSNFMIASSVAMAIALSGCGGGGGGGTGLVSTPAPTPTPTPTPTPIPTPLPFSPIIATATTSQQFANKGASYTSPQVSNVTQVVSSPSLADNAQLEVRYNASSQSYEVQFPAEDIWLPITLSAIHDNNLLYYRSSAPHEATIAVYRSNLQYSALLEELDSYTSSYTAIGIATLPGNVPVTGSASYAGNLLGASSESWFGSPSGEGWDTGWYAGGIGGSINLSFNFGSGALSGSIHPTLSLDNGYVLPSLNFTNTVYSSGSTVFSGEFATALTGLNSFSGLFTGPNGEELIGNFAFPYASPRDGETKQAAGAFVGRR